MLRVTDLEVRYGHIAAVKGVSLEVRAGEIVTIIGANGAGKTTTLRAISGVLRPAAGGIELDGEALHGVPPHEIVKRGIVQVPEGRLVFTEMTVYENLLMGAFARKADAAIPAEIEVWGSLFPILRARRDALAGTLSGGELQMLAIARGLMAKPRLLILDEPSLGLAPILVKEIFRIIRELRERGTTILLVEQNAQKALQVADRAYVMEVGRITLVDTAANLLRNEEVIHAYLGRGAEGGGGGKR